MVFCVDCCFFYVVYLFVECGFVVGVIGNGIDVYVGKCLLFFL